jgi:subtilisin-like proprotein convertase family protein
MVVSGTCAPAANSAAAKLTVNPLPTITITPGSPVCGGVAGTSGTLLTASGATTYTWSPANGLYTNAAATIAYVAGTPTATVYAAPAVNTVYTATGTNAATGCVGTGTVSVTYTPAAPTVVPASASICNPGGATQKLTILAATPINTTFTTGTIAVPILDNTPSGSTSILSVPLPVNAIISDMTVAVNLSHTWDGDMAIVLKAPNGKILNLDYFLTATGGTGATTGFVNTRFSSTGTASISTGSNPYTGIFRADAAGAASVPAAGPTGFAPNTGLWSDLWTVPNGNYTLALYDGFAGDFGTLTSWSINVTYTAGVPPPVNGIWSPATGLWLDSLRTIPYVAGTVAQTVWAFPGTSTNYSVTVSSIGPDAFSTFTNPAPIAINDGSAGSPYPATIAVSGLPTTGVNVKSVKISGISHTWSDDIDIVLQSPSGTNVTLMSDVGSFDILNNVNYTFDDAGGAMSTAAGNPTGTYHPTNNGASDTYPAPGPGAITDASPALANFAGGNANGSWKLFVVDDTFGDFGNIAGGYSITFNYPTAGCTSAARIVPITVNVPVTITAQPVNAAVCTDKVTSFSVTVTGTTPTYQWQVSIDNGNTFNNVANGGVYAGATTATLTITAPPVSMTGYLYRVVVTGTAPCGPVVSAQRLLTVNPLPTVTIAASPYLRLFPGLTTTLFSTVAPAASSYTWLRNGGSVAGGTNSSLLVNVDGLGDYTLRVTDVNGCTNSSNLVSLKDSASGKVFIYPNPNSGQFQVRYYSIINNSGLPRGVNVYDATGKRVLTQTYSITAPYARMDVNLSNYSTGVYWIEVVDVNGNRLAMGRAEVLR